MIYQSRLSAWIIKVDLIEISFHRGWQIPGTLSLKGVGAGSLGIYRKSRYTLNDQGIEDDEEIDTEVKMPGADQYWSYWIESCLKGLWGLFLLPLSYIFKFFCWEYMLMKEWPVMTWCWPTAFVANYLLVTKWMPSSHRVILYRRKSFGPPCPFWPASK